MTRNNLPLNQVICGDCTEVLKSFPNNSIDLIFADPPYNLQLNKDLWRPNLSRVDGVNDSWDQFDSFEAYDNFSRAWLAQCRRILKPDGAIWVIGTYHNIFRLGSLMQDLGFWLLNDVIWIKNNPTPNFHGMRFTNAHETLIWATKSSHSQYTFHHQAMKSFNNDKQMRSDWYLPICKGKERIRIDGEKAHTAQKPEALLYRVILSTSNPGDVILDPFFGTGTTGAVAKLLHRQWIGIEQDARYAEIARQRIAAVKPEAFNERVFDVRSEKKKAPRVPFVRLLEVGYLKPGQVLYFHRDPELPAYIKPDGKLVHNGHEGTIHLLGRTLLNGKPCNGWHMWYYRDKHGELQPIDRLREKYRASLEESHSGESP